MTRIIFATGNKDKMREIREIMGDMDVEILSMKEAGIAVDVDENGQSFEENALIKARAVAAAAQTMTVINSRETVTGEEAAETEVAYTSGEQKSAEESAKNVKENKIMVLADDSGLEIDYLNKEPGIYSARYMGEDTPYTIKNQALLNRLAGVPKEKRTARFVCAVAAVLPDGRELVTRQTMEGYIGDKPEGENGFGYDPIFYLDEYGCSSAVITPEQKNAISHRGKALRAMKELLG